MVVSFPETSTKSVQYICVFADSRRLAVYCDGDWPAAAVYLHGSHHRGYCRYPYQCAAHLRVRRPGWHQTTNHWKVTFLALSAGRQFNLPATHLHWSVRVATRKTALLRRHFLRRRPPQRWVWALCVSSSAHRPDCTRLAQHHRALSPYTTTTPTTPVVWQGRGGWVRVCVHVG